MKKTRHRTNLTLRDKIAILNDLDNKLTHKDIEAKYNICGATIYGVIRNKNQLLAKFQDPTTEKKYGNLLLNLSQSPLNTKFDINLLVLEFYKECINRNIPVSGSLLQQQARYFAKCAGIEDFKGSNGWLDRFQTRYNIYFKPQNFPMLSSEAELIKNKTVPFKNKGSFKEDIEEVGYYVMKNTGLPYKKICNEVGEEQWFLSEEKLQSRGLLDSQRPLYDNNEEVFVGQQGVDIKIEALAYNKSLLTEETITSGPKQQKNSHPSFNTASRSTLKGLEAEPPNLPPDDSLQPKPPNLPINAEGFEDTLKKLQDENSLQKSPTQSLEDLTNIEMLIEELESLQPLVDICLGTCDIYKECIRKAKLKRIALRYLSSKTRVAK